MPLKPVILNNTPLVALYLLQQWPLLHQLYGEVFIPKAVEREFLATATAERALNLRRTPWIQTVEGQTTLQPSKMKLDEGEAAVIALAIERKARLVIIDEQRGRQYVQQLGLPLTGTLGVLLAGKRKGYITLLTPLLDKLQEGGIYLDAQLVASVKKMAGE
jgi:uncharacterized protein